jgi:prophage antirepressor-like protein
MTQKHQIQLFEEKKVRTVWNDELQEWFFSVTDVVEVLTDSADVKQYIKKMRKRDPELDARWGTICTPTRMQATDGKYYNTQAATMEGVFRIIQSIPSKKAEPFKQWMAEVAAQRIDQMQDPELSIEQAIADYRRLGYSEGWINQRIRSIEVRKVLTDEWQRSGVEGNQYASLTDILTQEWSGRTTRQYKQYKGLKKESLRDNMTNRELVMNMLAELSTKEISESQNPETFGDHIDVARHGGEIARNARMELEAKTGKPVVSPLNAKDGLLLNKKEDGNKEKSEQ